MFEVSYILTTAALAGAAYDSTTINGATGPNVGFLTAAGLMAKWFAYDNCHE